MSGCRSKRTAFPVRSVLLSLMLLIVLITALTGCSNSSGPAPTRSGLNSPIEINYLVQNPIEIVELVEEKAQDYSYRSFTFTGLADQEIQNKINDRITSAYNEMREKGIPPYRGAKVRIPEGAKKIGENISVYPSGSFNNILSVSLNKYVNYAIPEADGSFLEYQPGQYQNIAGYGEILSLNFDLNTGEEISISAIFTDDTDATALLTGIMERKLHEENAAEDGYFVMTEFYNLKLTKPFTGIHADQEFYLNSWGLALVFDYRNTDFETNMQPAVVMIPWAELDGKAAVTARFYDAEKNIYTSTAPAVKSLLNGNDRANKQNQSQDKVGRVNVYLTTNYSDQYPEAVQQKIRELSTRDEARIQSMQAEMEAKSQEFLNQYGEAYYEQSVSAFSAGNYITVSRNVYGMIPKETPQDGSGAYQESQYYCFDKTTGKQVTLKDLFVPGYDPALIIKKALRDAINSTVFSYGAALGLSKEEQQKYLSEEYIGNLYEQIKGFGVQSDGLFFAPPAITVGTQTYPVFVTLTYKDIGCDNLSLFD